MPSLRTVLVATLIALAWATAWVLSTTAGARWLLDRLGEVEPRFEAQVASGTLWSGMTLRDLSWDDRWGRVGLDRLRIDWQPACLRQWTLCIDDLTGRGLVIDAGAGAFRAAALNADGRWPLSERGRFQLAIDGIRWRDQSLGEQPVRLQLTTSALQSRPRSATLRLDLPTLPLAALESWLPDGVRLPGRVSGSGRVDWRSGQPPRARLTLVSRASRVVLPMDTEDPLALEYQRAVIDADLRPQQVDLRFGMASPDLGRGGFALRVDPTRSPRPLDGEVWLDGLPAAPLAGALPGLRRSQGRIKVAGRVSGNLSRPRFAGDVAWADGLLLPRALARPLRDFRLRLSIDGPRAEIAGGFRAGEGEAVLSGRVQRQTQGLAGRVRLTGEDLAIDTGPTARVTLAPDLTVTLASGEARLDGVVDVQGGAVSLPSSASDAVRVSADAVRVDTPAPNRHDPDGGLPLALSTDVRLNLGEGLRFRGRGLTGELAGSLRLRQQGLDEPRADGVVRLVSGHLEAYGQRLEVRRGRLIFAGSPRRPRLDIEAVRASPRRLAGLRVTGPADDPVLTLFSRPPMEQSRILAYLMTGAPPGSGRPDETALISQAAVSLGVFGGDQIGGALAEEIGISDFRLQATGQGETAQVAVSGYLAPNLLIRYGVGVFTPQNTLSLRYYLTEQLYLEAVSGAESALDLFYAFDYD